MSLPRGLAAFALIALGCTSCAHEPRDYGPQTDALLTIEFIGEQFGATVPDLAVGARCPGTQEVSVVVVEQRTGRRTLSSLPGISVKYEDFARSVQRYFEDVLREAKIRVLPTGGRLLQVRIEDVAVRTGWGPAFGTTKLAVSAADWNHSATYIGEETSGTIERAIAYSVHEAVLAFLKDPQVQGNLRCTSE